MRHENDIVDEDCRKLSWSAAAQQRNIAFLWISCHHRACWALLKELKDI